MEIYHDQQNEVKWSSWLPALGYALGASKGPILEIGIGHFSTPFLHGFSLASERELWSIESDGIWRKEFDAKYGNFLHRFGYPSNTDIPDEYVTNKHWGAVFIDSSPGGEARAGWFRAFAPISQFIVVHDYWRDNEEAIGPLLTGMNYRVYKDYEPPTLLASAKYKL